MCKFLHIDFWRHISENCAPFKEYPMSPRHLLFTAALLVASAVAFAQVNAVPFINNPLLPDSHAPNGAAFTLTVRGTGFVSGSIVYWNGTPRITTFVSSSVLKAAIT